MDTIKRYRTISWLKTCAEEVARQLAEKTDALVTTQNGFSAFVCVGLAAYEQTTKTNALLRLLALGEREVRRGNAQSLESARAELYQSLFGDE